MSHCDSGPTIKINVMICTNKYLGVEIFLTRGRGHYMAQKEDCSYEINAYLFSFSHCVSLFSVCYQATNVSPSCLCVTVKQMLV